MLVLSQVRTIVTETSFTIDELEELYALFKVSFKVNSCLSEGMKRTYTMKRSLKHFRGSVFSSMHEKENGPREQSCLTKWEE